MRNGCWGWGERGDKPSGGNNRERTEVRKGRPSRAHGINPRRPERKRIVRKALKLVPILERGKLRCCRLSGGCELKSWFRVNSEKPNKRMNELRRVPESWFPVGRRRIPKTHLWILPSCGQTKRGGWKSPSWQAGLPPRLEQPFGKKLFADRLPTDSTSQGMDR